MGFLSFGYDVSVGLCILCKALRCEICKLLCCEIHKMQFGELWSLRNIWFFFLTNTFLVLPFFSHSIFPPMRCSVFRFSRVSDRRMVTTERYVFQNIFYHQNNYWRKTPFIRIFVGLKFANSFQVLQTISTIRFRHGLRNEVYLFVNKMGSFHSNDSSDLSHYKVILDSPISLYFSQ